MGTNLLIMTDSRNAKPITNLPVATVLVRQVHKLIRSANVKTLLGPTTSSQAKPNGCWVATSKLAKAAASPNTRVVSKILFSVSPEAILLLDLPAPAVFYKPHAGKSRKYYKNLPKSGPYYWDRCSCYAGIGSNNSILRWAKVEK